MDWVWLSSVKESMGLWRWAGRKAEGWHFSTLSRDWATVGCIDWIEKGLQYVRSAEARMDWYVAWAGVLMQITTISIIQIKSFKTLYAHAIIKVLICDLRFPTYGGISKLITYISSSHTLKCTSHRILHASSSAATCEVVRLWQSGLMPLHSLRLGAGVSRLPLFERWRTKRLIEYESLFHLWLIWQCERLDGLRLWTAGGTTNSLIFSQLCFTCQYRAKFETKTAKTKLTSSVRALLLFAL